MLRIINFIFFVGLYSTILCQKDSINAKQYDSIIVDHILKSKIFKEAKDTTIVIFNNKTISIDTSINHDSRSVKTSVITYGLSYYCVNGKLISNVDMTESRMQTLEEFADMSVNHSEPTKLSVPFNTVYVEFDLSERYLDIIREKKIGDSFPVNIYYIIPDTNKIKYKTFSEKLVIRNGKLSKVR